jgi:HlyD family secretion protein
MSDREHARVAPIIRDAGAQDRVIERPPVWQRHRGGLAVTIAVVAVAVVFVSYWIRFAGAAGSVDQSRLTIATVDRGLFVREVAADGQVVAAVSPTLYASSAGTVTLAVHAGDAVHKGQVLARINEPSLTARLSQEDASLEGLRIDWERAELDAARRLMQMKDAYLQAQVDLKTAQRELERSRKAYELGAYSELQMLRAQDALEKAKFAFTQAQTNYEAQPKQNRFDVESRKALLDRQRFLVEDLRRQVDELTVRSPVDGQVGQIHIADRASVAKDAPLITVVDLSALEVQIQVAENYARDLKPGMNADIEGDGRHWAGAVRAISPEVIDGQVTARISFATGRPEGLRQNQRLSVRVQIDRRNGVLMVDRGPFVDQGGGEFAYVVEGDVAIRRKVRLGEMSIGKVEVLDGLKAGDRVVIAGTEAFKDAERVILSH